VHPSSPSRGWPMRPPAAASGGVGGCLLLAVWASPGSPWRMTSYVQGPWTGDGSDVDPVAWVVTAVATVAALWALRWWPYLLVVSAALTVLACADVVPPDRPRAAASLAACAVVPAFVGVLGCAQGLARRRAGWAAAVVGLAIGARLFGAALAGATWLVLPSSLRTWQWALTLLGLAAVLPVAWWLRRGDPHAAGLPAEVPGGVPADVPVDVPAVPAAGAGTGSPAGRGRLPWRRLRPVGAALLALCVVLALPALDRARLSRVLGVSVDSLARHPYAETAVLGAVTVVAVSFAAALAGSWVLGGALAAATVQVAVAAPLLLGVATLALDGPARLLGVLLGVVLGLAAASTRWRVPAAGALGVLAAVAIFIAHAGTTGDPQKLVLQHRVVPALIVLVLAVAAATATLGALAPVLGRRGVLPVVLGPLASVLAVGGLQVLDATYLRDGLPESSVIAPVTHLATSGVLLLVAAAAVGGVGLAHQAGRAWQGPSRAGPGT